MDGINLCKETIENMLFEYEQNINNETTLDRIKGEIAVEILREVIDRIESCKDELDGE